MISDSEGQEKKSKLAGGKTGVRLKNARYRRLRPQEVVYVYSRLFQDCPQRALGHVAGVVWHCCVPIGAGAEPGFVAAGSLPVELEAASLNFRVISRYRNPARRPIQAATTMV